MFSARTGLRTNGLRTDVAFPVGTPPRNGERRIVCGAPEGRDAKQPEAAYQRLSLGIAPIFRIMPAALEEQFDRDFSKAQLVAEDTDQVATILR
jgi:hypothetical protein